MPPATPPIAPSGRIHAPSGASSRLAEASEAAKVELGRLFAAQRTWLTAREHHQGLRDAQQVLRAFRTATGLPVDRIQGIGGHWGRHPVLAWMEADHYPLLAAWLLEGGGLPGDWCRAVPPVVRPVPTTPPFDDALPARLSPAGEKVLTQWFVRWSETNARLQNVIGRALCAWVRRADAPAPRTPDWAMPVHETQERPLALTDQEPAAVTFRAAIAVTQRGARVVPMLRALQRAGWNFEQAERLPALPGRAPRITSARAWMIELGITDQLTSPANAAWHAWWVEQDRAVLESALTTAPTAPSPTGRSRPRL